MKRLIAITSLAALAVLGACSPKEQPAETTASPEAASESATASVLPPADYSSSATILSCDWPATKTDTAKTLLAKFKSYAEIGTIPGAEGMETQGVLIFPNDPRRRVEVLFFDDAMTQISSVIVRGDSQWTGPNGLHIGSSLGDVEAANSKPFKLSGFDWDYGGYVNDLRGGKLDHIGKCTFGVRFGIPDTRREASPIPDSVMGDRTLMSNNIDVIRAAPVVEELSVGWAAPDAPGTDDSGE